jgi:hypothetical protein
MDSTPFTKVLGLFWNRETDTLLLPVVDLSPFWIPARILFFKKYGR